ncbi:MAG: lipopolysaccharide kinase InaA family protein [Planctomycetota bacterium]
MTEPPAAAPDAEATHLELAGHRLSVAPAWEDAVRAALGEHLRRPEQAAGAEVIKHNKVRTVVRLPTAAGVVFCKRFRVTRALDRLAHLVRSSPARREWEALLRLARAGVSVPRPVLLAEERAAGGCLVGSVLATVEVAGAAELTRTIDALRAAGDEQRRPALLAALARAVRAVFAAGCDHPDLHLANFLVGPDEAIVALDLHSARLRGGPLGAGQRRKRLVKLAHSFGLFDPDTAVEAERELAWFCAAWSELDPELGAAGDLARELRRAARGLEARRLRSRDRRCLVDSTGFAVERLGGARVYRRREVPAAALLAAVDAEPLAVVHEHPRGRSRIVTVARPADFPGQGPLLVKHYLYRSLRRRLAGAFEPLPLRSWMAARACEVRGVPAPLHYGLVRRGGPVPRAAAVVMELIADVTMIHVLLQAEQPPAPAARRRLARDFGRVMGRFHAMGLLHRDLAVQNVLVRPRAGGGPEGWDVWVIDLDEVRAAPMSTKDKLRALTHMGDLPPGATRTDRLRFWRAYLAAGADEVLAPELARWGERGIGRRVGEALAARAAAKAARIARRSHLRPEPTNLEALEGA